MIDTFKGVVYPGQCDAMGHMNVQHYITALDQSLWHLMLAIGYLPSWIESRREGWADVRYEIDFKGELKTGCLFVVEAAVLSVGTTSIKTIHRFLEAESKSTSCEVVAVSVFFDLGHRRSKEIPESIRIGAIALGLNCRLG